jgi:hypothetical protein
MRKRAKKIRASSARQRYEIALRKWQRRAKPLDDAARASERLTAADYMLRVC